MNKNSLPFSYILLLLTLIITGIAHNKTMKQGQAKFMENESYRKISHNFLRKHRNLYYNREIPGNNTLSLHNYDSSIQDKTRVYSKKDKKRLTCIYLPR